MATYRKRVAHSVHSLRIRRWLFQFLELRHRNLVAEMPLQQLMRNESLRRVALRIDERDMMVDFADSLQFVGVAMMMRTSVHTDQEDGDVDPREAEKIELEFIHVGRFAIQEEE